MGMPAAVIEDPEHTDVRHHRLSGHKVSDVSAISMDAAVAGAATYGTGFLIRLKMGHVRIKKRF